ncbi:MAG: hypothetical protein QOI11_3799 [Candidatus Eremiobacteraeota bacterium]|jgi:hypothetical protein|nr:hypothetical protein [Candidatus Eremiobacteraeota bacterium]
MPNEFRFDDLDLREEPGTAKSPDVGDSTSACTVTCSPGTSHDTCHTLYC